MSNIPFNYLLHAVLDTLSEAAEETQQEEMCNDFSNMTAKDIMEAYISEFNPMMYAGEHCLVLFTDNMTMVYYLEGEKKGMLFQCPKDLSEDEKFVEPLVSNFVLCGCCVSYLSPITFGEFKVKSKVEVTSRYDDDTLGVDVFDLVHNRHYFLELGDEQLKKFRTLGDSCTPEFLKYLKQKKTSKQKPKSKVPTFDYKTALERMVNGKNVSRVAWQDNRYIQEHLVEALGRPVILMTTRKGADDCELENWTPSKEDEAATDYYEFTLRSEL